jgi:hypothetical protein
VVSNHNVENKFKYTLSKGYSWRQQSGGLQFEASPGKQLERPYLENTQHKKAGRVAQVVKCLPSKDKVLSSNPSTTKKKKEEIHV